MGSGAFDWGLFFDFLGLAVAFGVVALFIISDDPYEMVQRVIGGLFALVSVAAFCFGVYSGFHPIDDRRGGFDYPGIERDYEVPLIP